MKDPSVSHPHVILRHCGEYDADRIRTLARDGLRSLGLKPFGRTLVKPNLVAAGEAFPHAHTRAEVADGILRALRDVGGEAMSELAVGERCGITIPTRLAFSNSGFDAMLSGIGGVKRYCFEEVTQVEIRLTHAERLRDFIFVPEPVARADFFVNVPKFKAHPWTTVTFSMKNYIGIQDDRHRLIDHDHRLNEKIADLQAVLQPQFVCIDAIIAGQGRMLTPKPFPLNLLIMGDNQVAVDTVCCAIVGINANDVEHIRLAAQRGYGTTDLSQIQISGDVSLEDARRRARGFEVGLVRVEKYFEGTNITAYAGPPPASEKTAYCWGGCPGAMQEAIEILRRYDEQCDAKMPKLHVVFGAYEGPIDAKPGEKVVFIGDCATWSGALGDTTVSVESLYRNRSLRDPYKAEHQDIYRKMGSVLTTLAGSNGKTHLRLAGCPVSVAEQVLALVQIAKTENPYFHGSEIVDFNRAYLGWRANTALRRLMGEPYQRSGECPRGQARVVFDAERERQRVD